MCVCHCCLCLLSILLITPYKRYYYYLFLTYIFVPFLFFSLLWSLIIVSFWFGLIDWENRKINDVRNYCLVSIDDTDFVLGCQSKTSKSKLPQIYRETRLTAYGINLVCIFKQVILCGLVDHIFWDCITIYRYSKWEWYTSWSWWWLYLQMSMEM